MALLKQRLSKENTKKEFSRMFLDTYAWVEFFNGTEKGKRVKKILKEHACFTSAISLAELSEWIQKENLDRKFLDSVKKLSSVLPLENEILELAGVIKTQKRKTVKGISLIDAIIISAARHYNLKIVTGDKHFKGENVEML